MKTKRAIGGILLCTAALVTPGTVVAEEDTNGYQFYIDQTAAVEEEQKETADAKEEFVAVFMNIALPADEVAVEVEQVLSSRAAMRSIDYTWEYLIAVDPSTSWGWVATKDGETLFDFPVATGKGGLSDIPNSYGTPVGAHEVTTVVSGERQEIFLSRKPTGRIATENNGMGYVTTALLAMNGLEERNQNSDYRNIYVHGTNLIDSLGGGKLSSGCIRVSPEIAWDLAELATGGPTAVYVLDRPWIWEQDQ